MQQFSITINRQGSIIQRASDAAGALRILSVTSRGTLHLKELTIRNGEAEFGSGIMNEGNLELTRCTVDGNLGHNGKSGDDSQGFGGQHGSGRSGVAGDGRQLR